MVCPSFLQNILPSSQPDFLIIGAQKSGTTALYDYLSLHPQMIPAARKEVHYFDYGYHHGERWYLNHFPSHLQKWLLRKRTGKTVLTGEASPCYLLFDHSAERAYKMLPDAKLIVLLRNPVDRAFSQYQMNVNRGTVLDPVSKRRVAREPLTFEQAIDAEEERLAKALERLERDEYDRGRWLQMHSYKMRGHYAQQIRRWLEFYPREQMLILESTRLGKDTAATYSEVLRFLDLPHWAPATFPRSHEGKYKEKISPEMRTRLIEYFKPHNEELYDLLGIRFDWDR